MDGGLDIPHGDKRFVGYDTEAKKLDSEQLKKYIMGGHVRFLLLLLPQTSAIHHACIQSPCCCCFTPFYAHIPHIAAIGKDWIAVSSIFTAR